MNRMTAPTWSFLAVEPEVRLAVQQHPEAFRLLLDSTTSPSRRRKAFWLLFGAIEQALAKNAKIQPDRHQAVVKSFYALIDISEQCDMPDRRIQSLLKIVTKPTSEMAAVHLGAGMVSVA